MEKLRLPSKKTLSYPIGNPRFGWVDILRFQQLGLQVKTGVYEKICGKFSPVCQKMSNFAL